ncbi:uncharacterized protein J3R85_021015 [Psidium guajava]|nr:uncharacterized protein J3R85_021015 [Psidium guajava]
MRKRKRNDIAWQYCTVVDGNVGHVCCNFCGHVMWGGVTRLKQHLACIKGNVVPCRRCPPDVAAQIQDHLGQGSQKSEENIDGGSEQVNDVRDGGNEEQSQEGQEYWHKFTSDVQDYLTHSSPKNEENTNGYRHNFKFDAQVYLTHSSPKNEENQSSPMNEEDTNGDSEQDCWQKLSDEIYEYVTRSSQENDEHMDGGSGQVNDTRCEGGEGQLQPTQVCWRWSDGDDIFKRFREEMSDHGWGARKPYREMESRLKNEESKRALDAVLRAGARALTLWENRTPHGEGCSGTKPGPSYQEHSMTGDDSDDDCELGF